MVARGTGGGKNGEVLLKGFPVGLGRGNSSRDGWRGRLRKNVRNTAELYGKNWLKG